MGRAWLVLLAAVVFFANLADPLGLHQNDEDYYFAVARAMYDSGDWVVPRIEGAPTYVKPPLQYWMTATAMAALGPVVLAARLPVALLAVLTVLAVAALGRRLFDERAGMIAAAVTATSVGFFQYGRAGMMDVPLTLAVVAGAWGAFTGGTLVVAVACGLAVMLKGPVGALLILLAIAAWWGPRRPTVRARDALVGGALFLAIVSAWPLLLAGRGELGSFYRQFILGENLGKFSGAPDTTLSMLWGYLALALPWTPLALAALGLALVRRGWRDPALRLPLAFMAANMVVYALPAVKWPQYLLPSIPMAALLVGWACTAAAGRTMRITGWLLALVLLAAALPITVAPRLFPDQRILLFVVAASLVAAAILLIWGLSIEGAATAMACALACLAFVAPAFTLDRIPPELAAEVGNQRLITYGVPPQRYALAIGREVGVESAPEGFRKAFADGVLIAISDSDLGALMRDGHVDLDHAEMVVCWRKWQRRITIDDVMAALREGNRDVLTENVCVLRRQPR